MKFLKYKNAKKILPLELIEAIQQYVQGEYIYIPIKEKNLNVSPTEYEVELQKRDAHIYKNSLEGVSNKKLSEIYNLSESSIRRIIISQRKRYETMEENIKAILENWNVRDGEIKQVYDSTWQVGHKYILKVYDSLELLERNIKIVSILDGMKIPVGKIVLTKDETTFVTDNSHYFVLREKLHGSNVISMNEKPDIAMEMGEIIGKLHLAFLECEKQDEFWENSLLLELTGWIRESIEGAGWKYISQQKFDALVEKLESLYDNLPVQLIHRDVHFGNFLFQEGKFTGYIDFDLSQKNIRIFDLCYFMLGLLSEKEKLGVTEEVWFTVLEDVFTGYQKHIKLSKKEINAVPYVMQSIELLFVAWFASQNDVKCAERTMKIFDFVDKYSDKIVESLH